MGLLQLAIPLFVAVVALEWVVARRRRQSVHGVARSISNLACGILSQLVGLFLAVLAIGAYWYVEQRWTVQSHWSAPPFPSGMIGWLAAFVIVDFGQYAVHRLSHRMSFMWACHVVHHSSEDLNYTVALRNTSLHGLFTWFFTLPLAVLGIPWQAFATCYAINVAYQFWLHTRLIGRLGPLELVLNTPSHHRVHHGRNPEYVDRNFGGVLIIWDRLFGTFTREMHEPTYGVTPRLMSSNAVWANLHGWVEIGRAWRRAATWRDRFAAVFGPPEWPEPPSDLTSEWADIDVPRPVLHYALLQFASVLVGALFVIRQPSRFGWGELAGALLFAIVTLAIVGGMLDARSWAVRFERLRLVALATAAPLALAAGLTHVIGVAMAAPFAVASGVWLGRIAHHLAGALPGDDTREAEATGYLPATVTPPPMT